MTQPSERVVEDVRQLLFPHRGRILHDVRGQLRLPLELFFSVFPVAVSKPGQRWHQDEQHADGDRFEQPVRQLARRGLLKLREFGRARVQFLFAPIIIRAEGLGNVAGFLIGRLQERRKRAASTQRSQQHDECRHHGDDDIARFREHAGNPRCSPARSNEHPRRRLACALEEVP